MAAAAGCCVGDDGSSSIIGGSSKAGSLSIAAEWLHRKSSIQNFIRANAEHFYS
jgi:hypothetical protein